MRRLLSKDLAPNVQALFSALVLYFLTPLEGEY